MGHVPAKRYRAGAPDVRQESLTDCFKFAQRYVPVSIFIRIAECCAKPDCIKADSSGGFGMSDIRYGDDKGPKICLVQITAGINIRGLKCTLD